MTRGWTHVSKDSSAVEDANYSKVGGTSGECLDFALSCTDFEHCRDYKEVGEGNEGDSGYQNAP